MDKRNRNNKYWATGTVLRATRSNLSSSCKTLLVLFLRGATKWDKPAKWEASPLARLVPLRGPLLYQERWANAVGIPRLKLCQLSVIVLTSAARFSSVSCPQIWRELSKVKRLPSC
ncbi:Uncharacterized protein APZ42_031318 [Daphnia magna]|uniref:Uncharacterized protein n=1 Tax=Daphnia magna TaxID=35525 RepID=A0A164MYR6_9CRUS|nr:Uncharacterized protein APZ42_031318 [Daphnia magna]